MVYTGASEQQHKRDLKRIYIEGGTNSRIHHFLPECIAFNQSALHHEEFEDVTTDVTPPSRRPFSRGF